MGFQGKNIKSQSYINSYTNQNSVALYLANSHVYANGTNYPTNFPLEIVENQTVIKTVINLNEHKVEWFIKNNLISSFNYNEGMKLI